MTYYLPAEWHPQACVQLTWPHADTDWQPYLDDITDTFVQIAKAVAHYQPLLVVAKHPEKVRDILAISLTTDELQRVSIVYCDNDDTWARDHAFITLISNVTTEPCHMLDFCFNGWGEKFAAHKDNAINRTLHLSGVVSGTYIDCNDFVLEGGSIESDGCGTLLTTSQCLMAPHRNQPLTQQQIEAQLKLRLGATKVVWLDHGQLIGDDTDGHIDTIVRICPNNTLLYVGCDDAADPQYVSFTALEQQLATISNAHGEPFRLLRLPMPTAIYHDGERLPATYANFLIINGAVIVPTYNQPQADALALSQVAEAFPGYDIIGIDSRTIIKQHGSIHCLTMQYPIEAAPNNP